MPRFSIIIPTALRKLDELLKPCIESIVQYTDLSDVEVIVVANGCEDDTDGYVRSLGEPFRLLSYPDKIGYTKAMNAGIRAARGEFVIPYNNDNILLNAPKNQWLEMLHTPFDDPQVMACGPWLNYCPWAERNFLIFFCCMIRASVFPKVGLLDEIFAPAYGEDADFCCRVEDAGYKVAACDITEYRDGMGLGHFPIFHKGNASYKDWPGGIELLAHNRGVLAQRYGSNIERAKQCDGFISDNELKWLSKQARRI